MNIMEFVIFNIREQKPVRQLAQYQLHKVSQGITGRFILAIEDSCFLLLEREILCSQSLGRMIIYNIKLKGRSLCSQ